MSHTFDPIDNTSNNEHFQEVLDKALSNPSRRNILRGGLGLASMFALPMLPGCGGTSSAPLPALASSTLLKFTPVAKSIADQVWVPAGYTAKVLHATGDTLNAGALPYSNAGTDDAESWANRVGDQHDGTEIFYIGANGKSKGSYSYAAGDKAVLAVNNESSAEATSSTQRVKPLVVLLAKNSISLAPGTWAHVLPPKHQRNLDAWRHAG